MHLGNEINYDKLSFEILLCKRHIVLGQIDPRRSSEIVRKDSWYNDLVCIFKNKTFMLCCIAGTFSAFSASCVAWWGPHFFIDDLTYRNDTLPTEETSSDPQIER